MRTFLFGDVDALRELRGNVTMISGQLVVCCSICGLLQTLQVNVMGIPARLPCL